MKTITCKPVINSNRVSLTKEVRDILNVKEGDYIQFVNVDGKIYLHKVESPATSEVVF